MAQKLYLDLAKLVGARVIVEEDSYGDEVEGIFIPFAKNSIKKKRSSAKLVAIAKEKKPNPQKQTHYIEIFGSKDWWDEMRKLGIYTDEDRYRFVFGASYHYHIGQRVTKRPPMNLDSILSE